MFIAVCLGMMVRMYFFFLPPTLLVPLTLQVGFLKRYNFFKGFSLNVTFEND